MSERVMAAETITIAVDVEISYEANKGGAREYAVKTVVEAFPVEEVGFNTEFGRYTIKRGDRRLMEGKQ